MTKALQIIDPVTSAAILGYRAPGHVWPVLYPEVDVPNLSGKVRRFGREDWRRRNTEHAPGADVARVMFGHDADSYALSTHALDGQIPDQHDVATEGLPGRALRIRAAQGVLNIMSLSTEIEAAAKSRNTANYSAGLFDTLSGTDLWDDYVNSDPISAIKARMQAVRKVIGVKPNTAVIPEDVWDVISEHPKVTSRMNVNAEQLMTPQIFARLCGLERVEIAGAVELDNTDTVQDIWGKDVILAYVARNPSTPDGEPSYGYTYKRRGHPQAKAPRRHEDTRSWLVGVDNYRSPQMTSMDAGYLIKGVVS